ncbi:MAG: DNA-3-methyladenine glycosylase I [Azoarcus sp.]|jgi:DNA-3-methyladenine glycosylase I|nr:DNA-3-methyladenine glycosylase I [Azoarcus sp.]
MPDEIIRCDWANANLLTQQYHDHKWGIPVHNERELFKMLILEGQQAGLSWSTILKKMDTLCAAFDDFDPRILAGYGDAKVEQLLQDPGIIRNRLKINAAIQNAKAYFKLCEHHGSLDAFIWAYVDGKPIINEWSEMKQIPARTGLSDTISQDLQKYGFKFVGSTIAYAFMQSVGLVNDHLLSCHFRR